MSSSPIKIVLAHEAPEWTDIPPKRGRPASYPFEQLDVGDCFAIPTDRVASLRTILLNRNRALSPKLFSIQLARDGKLYVRRDN